MDWPDPEVWKKPAEIIGYGQSIFVGAVAIIGAVVALLRWGLAPFRWIASKLSSRKNRAVDKRPLRFVPEDRQTHWSPARAGDQEVTHVHGHWHVTNISGRNVTILRARLDGYQAKFSNVYALRPMESDLEPRHLGSNVPILDGRMSEIWADFTYFSQICDGRDALVADVIFTDNYEEAHRIRSVRFPYRGP